MALPTEQVGRSLLEEGPAEGPWAVWKAGEVLGRESKKGQRMPQPWETLSRGGKGEQRVACLAHRTGRGRGHTSPAQPREQDATREYSWPAVALVSPVGRTRVLCSPEHGH